MEKIYQKLRASGLNPNQLYVLWSIRENLSPSMVNIAMEMRAMGSEWIDNNTLTGKALSLLMEIDETFKDKKAKNDVELMGKDWKEKIAEYRLIFPDRKLQSGKHARDTVKNMEPCFRWFFNNHDFDWETIFKATRKYCQEYMSPNDKYHQTSKYFIRKVEAGIASSNLGNYCEMIVTGGGDDGGEDIIHFPTKVV